MSTHPLPSLSHFLVPCPSPRPTGIGSLVSVVITSHTVARYTGNPLMRYRWLMLMFLSGGVTTIYLFIMPMCAGGVAAGGGGCRCRQYKAVLLRFCDNASLPPLPPRRPVYPPPYPHTCACRLITARSQQALGGMGLTIVRLVVHPAIWSALLMLFRFVLRHIGFVPEMMATVFIIFPMIYASLYGRFLLLQARHRTALRTDPPPHLKRNAPAMPCKA